jgi:DNA repair exonuclease SbcCD ATPase subunit
MSKDNETVVRCPVCNQVISDFENGISDPCEHVMLICIDACGGEFVHVGDGAEELEKKMEEKYEDDYTDLNEQMEKFAEESDDHEMLEMTTYGMSCGPCSGTEYILVKIK